MKGFWDKCVEAAHNVSAICSLYSGEEVLYTTVKRGSLKFLYFDAFQCNFLGSVRIPKNRVSISGCIQPGPLLAIIHGNGGADDQGVFDRFLMFPGAEVRAFLHYGLVQKLG